MSGDPEKGEEVGYGKPPKSGQFRKGQSGNPKGRPKGTRNFTTDVETVLDATVTITENGKPRKVSTRLATLMRLKQKALKGDARAMETLLELAQKVGAEREARQAEQSLSASDEEILQRFFAVRNGTEDPGPTGTTEDNSLDEETDDDV